MCGHLVNACEGAALQQLQINHWFFIIEEVERNEKKLTYIPRFNNIY